jgi:hypothetical protein
MGIREEATTWGRGSLRTTGVRWAGRDWTLNTWLGEELERIRLTALGIIWSENTDCDGATI